MKGRVHSFQSLGAVDGPGLRYIVFLQGCTLRCAYCHNPDTWDADGGTEYSVEDVLERILRCRPYFARNGGVTVSGGEPLLQSGFVAELFRQLHEAGIHTALDTAGIGDPAGARRVLRHTDLCLCDLKFTGVEKYRELCNGSMTAVLRFMKLTEELGVPLWIRHVVVPGLNDGAEQLRCVAATAAGFTNLERLELLPFRKLCEIKYRAMGLTFPLHDAEECPDDLLCASSRQIRQEFPELRGRVVPQ